MSYFIEFSKYNPYRMYEAEAILPDKHQYPGYGRAMRPFSARANQLYEDYDTPILRSQVICIMFDRGRLGDNTGASNPTELYLEDETGKNLKTLGIAGSATIAGKKDPQTGDQLYTEMFLFAPADYTELDNTEYLNLRLRAYYQGGDVLDYRSDRFIIADSFDGHSLIEYNCSYDKDGTLFDTLKPRYSMLIPSTGFVKSEGGEHEVFTEQDQSIQTTYSQTQDILNYQFGGIEGIPEDRIDILDDATRCEYVRIDGVDVKRKGQEINRLTPNDKFMHFCSIEFQHAEEGQFRRYRKAKIKICDKPASYPFALARFAVFDGINFLGVSVKVVDGSLGNTAFMADLNAQVSAGGFTGSFVEEGGAYYFINGANETFNTLLPALVFPDCLTITASVAVANDSFRYRVQYPNTTTREHVVCWAATSGTEERVNNLPGQSDHTVSKSFSTTGTKTIRIFHNGEIYGLYFQKDSSYPVQATNWSGKVPSTLRNLLFQNHNFNALTTLSFAPLANAKDVLYSVYIMGCGVKGITSNWATGLVSGAYKPFRMAKVWTIENNELTSTNVDAFLNEFYASVNYVGGGYISLKFNSPLAPRTSASDTAVTALTTATWAVNTD